MFRASLTDLRGQIRNQNDFAAMNDGAHRPIKRKIGRRPRRAQKNIREEFFHHATHYILATAAPKLAASRTDIQPFGFPDEDRNAPLPQPVLEP